MHDPEKFQQETIKAITDLQETFRQTMSRQLALGEVAQPCSASLFTYSAETGRSTRQKASRFPSRSHLRAKAAITRSAIRGDISSGHLSTA